MNTHHKREQWFLAIDQGGHASRALLYDADGELLDSTYCEIETLEKANNIVEHDAIAFVESVQQVVNELAAKLGEDVIRIQSVGLACQRSSIVCWNKDTGEALSPIISWQDRRTDTDLQRYARYQDLIRDRTGLLLNPHYGASKMRWCLENLPAVEEAKQQGTLIISPVATYLLFHLLEQHPIFVDPANAGRTLLYDYKKGDWCEELLEAFDIDRSILPTCVPSKYDFGSLGLNGHSVNLRVCTGDQSAAVFYSGMPQSDSLYINAGTGAFVQQIRNDLFDDKVDGLLKSIVYADDKNCLYVKEGTVNGAGRALQWYGEKTGRIDYTDHLEKWFAEVESPPMFLNAISGVGSPFWTSFSSRFDRECAVEDGFVAIVESILFLLKSNIRLFDDFARIYVSGGLSNSDTFCQYLASLSGVVVCRQKVQEATSKGLFMLLSGKGGSPEVEQTFSPDENIELNQRYLAWRQEMVKLA